MEEINNITIDILKNNSIRDLLFVIQQEKLLKSLYFDLPADARDILYNFI